MIYSVNVEKLPNVVKVYTVIRKTIWQVADPYNILLIVLNGECIIETSNKKHKISAGNTVLIHANQSYRRYPANDEPCEIMYIHFNVSDSICELSYEDFASEINKTRQKIEQSFLNSKNQLTIQMKNLYIPLFNQENSDAILEICKKINIVIRKFRIDNSIFLTLYLCQILSLISKSSIENLLKKNTQFELVKIPMNLRKAVWYIKQNESKKITLSDLCEHCNTSQAQMIRYFKNTFSKTPMQYIAEFKINRAREMFLNTSVQYVKNVCNALGFDDPHYFSRLFKKITGETPSQYRYRVIHFKELDK